MDYSENTMEVALEFERTLNVSKGPFLLSTISLYCFLFILLLIEIVIAVHITNIAILLPTFGVSMLKSCICVVKAKVILKLRRPHVCLISNEFTFVQVFCNELFVTDVTADLALLHASPGDMP